MKAGTNPFRPTVITAVLGVLLLGITSCAWWQPDVTTPAESQFVASDLPRDANPQVGSEEVSEVVRGNLGFAFDLLHELTLRADNLFFSPYSISSALAMTYAGAQGETETQMTEVLHFDSLQQGVHPAFNLLDLQLNQRDEPPWPYEGEGFTLRIANAVWGQEGYGFLEGFLDTLALNYGAGLRLLDFVGNPKGSRITINDWVSDETEGKVEDLLPPGTITSDTRLVLTNAIYFKAPWYKPFDEAATEDGTFHTLAGSTVTVSMMHQEETFRYARFEGGQAVELPYNGEQLSMVLFVPDAGEYQAFEAGLGVDRYQQIVTTLKTRQVALGLPRFDLSYEVALPDPLKALGMTDAFLGGTADFSAMDGSRSLFLSNVQHKAFVTVDEIGTEAAAATAVVVDLTGVPAAAVTLTIDRPFLFIIRDVPTGTILFMGRVVAL